MLIFLLPFLEVTILFEELFKNIAKGHWGQPMAKANQGLVPISERNVTI